MRKTLILAVLTTLISGCATKYQSVGFTGGFTETQLAPDVFRVSFSGNGYTSGDRVQDFALLRAAELMLANNFPYFVLIDSADQSQTGTVVVPGSSQTTGTVRSSGSHATYSSTTTTNPAQVYNVYRPGVGLMVRGLKSPPEQEFAFDAAFIVKTLKAKYKIE